MPYREAMERFGSDKPDIRFGLELVNVSDLVENCGFKVFSDAVKNGGSVRAINAKGCGEKFKRKEIDALVELVKTYGAKGMAWIVVEENGLKSSITKFFSEDEMNAILQRVEAKPGDLICFVADKDSVVFDSLGQLRLEIARKLGLTDSKEFKLLWVTEFPYWNMMKRKNVMWQSTILSLHLWMRISNCWIPIRARSGLKPMTWY